VAELFEIIVGEKLSAITFVLDYWQLQFDGSSITALTRLEVRADGRTLRNTDDQFRNLICSQIGKTVRSVTFIAHQAFTLDFEDQSSISISLKKDDYRGPEALVFFGPDRSPHVVI
jgi:hypothetical protein